MRADANKIRQAMFVGGVLLLALVIAGCRRPEPEKPRPRVADAGAPAAPQAATQPQGPIEPVDPVAEPGSEPALEEPPLPTAPDSNPPERGDGGAVLPGGARREITPAPDPVATPVELTGVLMDVQTMMAEGPAAMEAEWTPEIRKRLNRDVAPGLLVPDTDERYLIQETAGRELVPYAGMQVRVVGHARDRLLFPDRIDYRDDGRWRPVRQR